MDGKYITGICTVFVAVLMVGGLLMPIIDHTTEGEPVINPDAGWIRMNYDTAASAYTINISASDDGITVSNGTDTQTGDDETIYYADSNLAVWLEDGYFTVLGQSTNGPAFFQSEDDITITRDSEGVTVTDGTNTVSVGAPTWAYVPYSSGSYGFFADGVAASTNNKPTVAVGGGFAGVYAYNNITRYAGLGLELQTVTEGGKITGAYWAKPAADDLLSITPLDPGSITIRPLDPSILDPEPDASIMAVPTPTYTDGVWGYDLDTIDGVQKAIIVSYSGAGGDIVVPATVGGYDVHRVGNVAVNAYGDKPIADNSALLPNTTITITSAEEIGSLAFAHLSNVVAVNLPSNLKKMGSEVFSGTGVTHISLPYGLEYVYSTFASCSITEIILPPTLKTIQGQNLIYSNSAAKIVVIPDSVTTMGSGSTATILGTGISGLNTLIIASSATPSKNLVSTAANLTEVLDLSDTIDYSVNRYGIPAAATVQDNIGDSIGYLGAAFIPGESDLSPSAVALMYIIPALILVSLIIFGAVVFVRRDY